MRSPVIAVRWANLTFTSAEYYSPSKESSKSSSSGNSPS
ncbi:hypothetical protein ND2E_2957 [Colwellia psychrerythraea]|uniref:Uncharacterized protein n=1 Tax=Colwellia psychrerythraea TaxID=28229 RepID=A0A099KPM5_COLPS|nr:hypothetical protein ND2E_2957 [Colwellia psychrerythraea]